MVQANIYFDEEEDKIIESYSKKWNLPKFQVVRRIVKEFEEKKK